MKHLLLISSLFTLFLSGCNDDFGTKTITYTKATAVYGDLDEIRSSTLVVPTRTILNSGKVFIANDFLLIGEETEGIHVFDNTNPAAPVNKLFINIPNNREFYVEGNYLFAESTYDMLKIDMTNPYSPILVARANDAFASPVFNDEGLALVGFDYEEITETADFNSPLLQESWSDDGVFYFDFRESLIPPSAVPSSFAGNSNSGIGSVNRITYTNNHVYAVSRSHLLVFNDEGTFKLSHHEQYAGNEMETIYPLNGKLYVGSRNAMTIFDITDPDTPIRENEFWHQNSCDPVFPVNDNTAYLTLRTGDFAECPGDENQLLVLDIQSNWSIEATQTIAMESPYGMTMIGDRLYVGEGTNGLKVFDATNRKSIVLEKWDKDVEAYDVIAHPSRPNLVLIAGPEGFSQYQKSSDDNLALLSTIAL